MEQSGIDVITGVVGQLGFPIFVAVWMLIKSSKDTEKMTSAINELKTAIQVMNDKKGD